MFWYLNVKWLNVGLSEVQNNGEIAKLQICNNQGHVILYYDYYICPFLKSHYMTTFIVSLKGRNIIGFEFECTTHLYVLLIGMDTSITNVMLLHGKGEAIYVWTRKGSI